MRGRFKDARRGWRGGWLLFGLLGLAGVALLGAVVMQLWNWLMPALFAGVNAIGYWQALGLLLLSKILFGWRGHGGRGRWHRHRAHWDSLTPEERERIEVRMKARWGGRFGRAPEARPNDSEAR